MVGANKGFRGKKVKCGLASNSIDNMGEICKWPQYKATRGLATVKCGLSDRGTPATEQVLSLGKSPWALFPEATGFKPDSTFVKEFEKAERWFIQRKENGLEGGSGVTNQWGGSMGGGVGEKQRQTHCRALNILSVQAFLRGSAEPGAPVGCTEQAHFLDSLLAGERRPIRKLFQRAELLLIPCWRGCDETFVKILQIK